MTTIAREHPASHVDWLPADGGGHPPANFPVRPLDAPLDVVAVISNPMRYRSRYSLYREFAHYVEESGARLTTVELALGDRPFEVTDEDDTRHVRLRTRHELWHKECLVNVGISRLPHDWRYVAWVDADVRFGRHDWVQETIQLLQHHQLIQMFSHAQDLGPDHEPLRQFTGWAYCYRNGIDPAWRDAYYSQGGAYWHPGFAWAARREAIDHLGGLIDVAILGAADLHMAAGLVGRMAETVQGGMHPAYVDHLLTWQERAERHIRRNIGYMPGLLLHKWHGKKKDRGYSDRWKILVQNEYSPDLDLKRDSQGVWQLVDHGTPRSICLRDEIRDYFKSRSEDSIDV